MKKPEKLSKEVVDLLLPRLTNEFEAFYQYRAMANWAENAGFKIAASFFAKESQSELEHAKKIEKYLTDWNIIPILPSIRQPETNFSGIASLPEKGYSMEYNLYEAYEETSMKIFKTGDLCVFDFLQFFRQIQKESVAEYSDMLNVLEGVNEKDKFQMLLIEEKLFNK